MKTLIDFLDTPVKMPMWCFFFYGAAVGWVLFQLISEIYRLRRLAAGRRTEKQIIRAAMEKGYSLTRASTFEVGLLKNGKGCRTWWTADLEGRLPSLAHPKVQEAIKICESMPEGVL